MTTTTERVAYDVEVLFSDSGKRAGTDERFDEFLDCVMDEFAKIGYADVDLTAKLADRVAYFVIPAAITDEDEEPLIQVLTALRTVLHAAGCKTSDWPTRHEIRMAAKAGEGLVPA